MIEYYGEADGLGDLVRLASAKGGKEAQKSENNYSA
ncbi:hypothetical protein T479_22600 [Lysinibacillus varians]|nr:hypothetical protein T479_22600 [Lysinibacillus varians]